MFSCRGPAAHAVDLCLARASALLIRSGAHLWVDVADADPVRACLAFAGVGIADAVMPDRAREHVELIGGSLDPVATAQGLDAVRVRVLHAGAATRWLLRRRWPWTDGKAARLRCAAVLHGDDAVIEWERRLWLPRRALASADLRRVARPILLDRAARTEWRPGRLVLASAGALTRWAFT